MDEFRIRGGHRLRGEVTIRGSKNAALVQMAASVLAAEPVDLLGVPRLGDIRVMGRLLRSVGMHVSRQQGDRLRMSCQDRTAIRLEAAWARRLRASICLLGPLLARRGAAIAPLPGGCQLGRRPIDVHLRGLAALGAEIAMDGNRVTARAGQLRGARVDLRGPHGPSVTGTANVLMAAVLAKGPSLLTGAAREPEVLDLVQLLRQWGARIGGEGTDELHVEGTSGLGGGCRRVIPDRLEAATFAVAATLTEGAILLHGVRRDHLAAVLEQLVVAGATVQPGPCGAEGTSSLQIVGPRRPRTLQATALPYPGLPTDAQPLLTALATCGDGSSQIRDAVFPRRWTHVAGLRKLGGRLQREGGEVRVEGVARLVGRTVRAHDLRCGAALVVAALWASGETRVQAAVQIDRGYHRLEEAFRQLGADIRRVRTSQPEMAVG